MGARRRNSSTLIGVAIVLVAAGTAVQGRLVQERQDDQVTTKTSQVAAYERQRNVLATDVETLRKQVTFCKQYPEHAYCQVPAVPAPSQRLQQVQGAKGDRGDPGRPPTQAEVAAAVVLYMQSHPVKNGRPPSKREIAEAVTAYLSQNPPPSGAPGKDGRDGADGATGPEGPAGVQGPAGPQGPPPSEQQVKAAVEEYFAAHSFTCKETEPGTWTCQVAS